MQIGAGIYKSRKLLEPTGQKTRPTSHKLRLSLFNILQHKIEGSIFLDLFAGVGAVGLEAISRGAKSSVFVEKELHPFKLIKENAKNLGCTDQCRFFFGDVLKTLEKELKGKEVFDIIFADPPYGLKLADRLYSERLLIAIAQGGLLRPGGDLFIEEGVKAISYPDSFEAKTVRTYGNSYLHHFIFSKYPF